MNNTRREALDNAHSKLLEVVEELERIADEEREAFDNLPEGLQVSERGEAMEEAADTIDEAREAIDEICGELWDIIEPLYASRQRKSRRG